MFLRIDILLRPVFPTLREEREGWGNHSRGLPENSRFNHGWGLQLLSFAQPDSRGRLSLHVYMSFYDADFYHRD